MEKFTDIFGIMDEKLKIVVKDFCYQVFKDIIEDGLIDKISGKDGAEVYKTHKF
jgi:hypothetical protein